MLPVVITEFTATRVAAFNGGLAQGVAEQQPNGTWRATVTGSFTSAATKPDRASAVDFMLAQLTV